MFLPVIQTNVCLFCQRQSKILINYFSFIDDKMRICITLNVKDVYEKIGLRNILDRKIRIVQNEINRREEIIDTYLQVRFLIIIKIINICFYK
jgi:hypothetical protein